MPEPPALGSLIATGRTAEIFAWNDGRVIKLTRSDFPAYLADQEWRNAQLAWRLGIPVPRPIEILDVDGRRGVVFERIAGTSLAQSMRRSPWRIDAHACQMARLHAQIHTVPAPELPSQKDRIVWNLARAVKLPESLRTKVIQLVADLSDDNTLCHGDFHPENVMITLDGPMIIDWEGCMRGSPSADVAGTCLWIRSALTFGKGVGGWVVRRLGQRFEKAYLTEYNRVAPGRLGDLDRWVVALAACRMDDEHRDEFPYLLRIVTTGVTRQTEV